MSEIINLKRAKKRRERAAKEAEAAVNREKHGQKKEVRDAEEAREDLRNRLLDANKMDEPDEPDHNNRG